MVTSNIALWRQKSRDGTITMPELKDAVAFLRQGRVRASEVSAASRAKKVKAVTPVVTETMQLEGM